MDAGNRLKIKLPKNLGDVIYTFRYRKDLPESIREKAPQDMEWAIRPAGSAQYVFEATPMANIVPNQKLTETKIPDSTPGVIDKYALSDEQALLAKIRYNRLIDIFTGVACYSLQNHLRTAVAEMGQVETDEIYIGIDSRGAHYVFPVQAKGGNDKLGVVQIEQDIAVCANKFPDLICKPLAAQFIESNLIALFEFEQQNSSIKIVTEKHYRLVPSEELSFEELQKYSQRSFE